MSAILAQNALIGRLQGMAGGTPLAYPGGPSVNTLPRIVVQISANAQRTITVGGQTEGTAEIVAQVETEAGQFAGEANTIVQAIVDRFPVPLTVDGVTMLEAPNPRPAFTADGVYAVPVIIRGRYHF